MSTTEEAWYSFSGKPYTGKIPPFPEGDEFVWLRDWQKNKAEIFPLMVREVSDLLSAEGLSLETYFNTSLVQGEGQWKLAFFYQWGKRFDQNCARCPEIARWLESVPGLLSAAVSVLPPHTEILPHIGDTSAVARCHLGLRIPADLPECGLDVNGESRGWKEKEWLIFCDAYSHSTWNKTNAPRYVLIIDVLWPQYETDREKICRNVLSMLRLQALEIRRPWVKKLPGKVRGLLRKFYTFSA